jgi:hypothetical protein
MKIELRRGSTVAMVALVLLACSGLADEQGPRRPAIDPAPAPAAPRVRVFVDPATGKLREPTVDELRELAEARWKSRAAQAPRVFEVVTHPDGMKSVDLGDAFLFDLRIEKLPDGSRKTSCVPHATPPAAGSQGSP